MSEGRCCDAVIKMLEEKVGSRRAQFSLPDKVERKEPAVDCRLLIGNRCYAIEHTQIEPYQDQIRIDKSFEMFSSSIGTLLDKKLPIPGFYRLTLPSKIDVSAKNFSVAQKELVEWVSRAATDLWAEYPERKDRKVEPRGFIGTKSQEFKTFSSAVSLSREVHWGNLPSHDGRLVVRRGIRTNRSLQDSVDRIGRDLPEKLSKLAVCRPDITVLVLEDQGHTDFGIVEEVLHRILGSLSDLPDFIYLVEAIGATSTVRLIVENGQLVDEYCQYREFNTDTLVDITRSEGEERRGKKSSPQPS